MFLDSLHNEIVLSFMGGDHLVCNKTFKGILAYDGNSFHDLDVGTQTHDPANINSSGYTACSSTLGNKTIFGGWFRSVGSNTVKAVSLAQWDGTNWDMFPKTPFTYKDATTNWQSPSIYGFSKFENKLWIYGGIDSLGGVTGKNLFTFDGANFAPVNIPVDYNNAVLHSCIYNGELYLAGGFGNIPLDNYHYIIRYKNGIWNNVGTGVKTSLGGVYDMVVYKDTLYVAGSYQKSDGNAGNNLMKWDGTQWYDAGFGGFYGWGGINQLLVFNNRLYAFGNFDYAADQKAFKAAFYENGKWTVNTDSIDNAILNAVVYKNEIYVSGGFWSIGGDTSKKFFAKVRCPDFDNTCTVGLKENSFDYSVSIFPNPIEDKFNVNFNSTLPNKMNITNLLGQKYLEINNIEQKNEVDISVLSKGIYFLNVQFENQQKTFKIVKK
jgi:hypothetical protein